MNCRVALTRFRLTSREEPDPHADAHAGIAVPAGETPRPSGRCQHAAPTPGFDASPRWRPMVSTVARVADAIGLHAQRPGAASPLSRQNANSTGPVAYTATPRHTAGAPAGSEAGIARVTPDAAAVSVDYGIHLERRREHTEPLSIAPRLPRRRQPGRRTHTWTGCCCIQRTRRRVPLRRRPGPGRRPALHGRTTVHCQDVAVVPEELVFQRQPHAADRGRGPRHGDPDPPPGRGPARQPPGTSSTRSWAAFVIGERTRTASRVVGCARIRAPEPHLQRQGRPGCDITHDQQLHRAAGMSHAFLDSEHCCIAHP